jgi:hypothetical protein
MYQLPELFTLSKPHVKLVSQVVMRFLAACNGGRAEQAKEPSG